MCPTVKMQLAEIVKFDYEQIKQKKYGICQDFIPQNNKNL